MPIILTDLNSKANTQAVKTYSPKFFDSKLTGNGKNTGLLKEQLNPKFPSNDRPTTSDNFRSHKRQFTNGSITTTYVPMDPIGHDGWDVMREIDMPDLDKLTCIGIDNKYELYIDMKPYSLTLEEITAATKGQSTGTTRRIAVAYQIFLYNIYDKSQTAPQYVDKGLASTMLKRAENKYTYVFTCSPHTDLTAIVNDLSSQYTINPVDAMDWLEDYDLYTAIGERSEQWQTYIDKTLDTYFRNLSKTNNLGVTNLYLAATTLRKIEDYNVPLDLYRNIYRSIQTHFSAKDATELCKQNLNLLLSDTLNSLHTNRANLTQIPGPPVNMTVPASVKRLSPEQYAAVSSTNPLILVQSGAGTGKSTVILSRIDYMIAAGVQPEDITVLSFTNAAANHISERNSRVHSMTIARMIHTIYEKNFPTHELSSLETIVNSLDIYFPTDSTAKQFMHYCKLLLKNDNNAFTAMNNFIETNFDTVIKLLDTIRQTSLELEIIICYQRIDKLQEPPEVQSKYLIIDEVQDNSIFEFVYTLKYVDKHKESLFIVGDCSQTLYEFRASNPRAINVLEGSGVFQAFKLQVNYRSNQEILDFANVLLQNIEANQYANIQLRANNLSPVTYQSFTEKVNFYYHGTPKIRDFDDGISSIFVNTVKPYIDDKLAKHEQIAFLAFSRRHVALMEKQLQTMYPNNTVASLVPARMKNSTIFSEFIRRYWNEVRFSPSTSICAVIANTLMSKITYMVYGNLDKLKAIAQNMLAQWRTEQQSTIDMWQRQYMNQQITFDKFMEYTKHNMLSYEIKTNAVKQALLSAQNEATKNDQANQTADMVLSTIHSAKGLEFPHVVLICRAENNMDEEKKRMYYVALTRAMKSEFVIAYDTVKSPQMEADYKQIVSLLKQKAIANGTYTPPVTPAPVTN